MRKQLPDQSRDMTFEEQERLVGEHQMQVTDLLSRGLFDVLTIRRTGTCPHGETPWIYARCSDLVVIDGCRYQSAIGGFAPGAGVRVYYGCYGIGSIGVVPGVPAEVLPAIGT